MLVLQLLSERALELKSQNRVWMFLARACHAAPIEADSPDKKGVGETFGRPRAGLCLLGHRQRAAPTRLRARVTEPPK